MNLHLVGGFLGSGKTTAILEAARLLVENGQRVGIITNEQGKHLVDTAFLSASGMPVLEVTGGCICCHLDDFEERIAEISTKFNPQVLFAESVGSCTDLVATVIKPLTDLHKNSAHPVSLSVFADSRLLLRFLRGMELPFSDSVIYIFEKQIEETNLLIANKIDLLLPDHIGDLIYLAAKKYPQKTIRLQNSLDSVQVAEWLALIQTQTRFLPDQSLKINYDIYAEGESQFAWLDRELNLTFSASNQGELVGDLILQIVNNISETGLCIAHLKFLTRSDGQAIKINLTSQDDLDQKITKEILKLNLLKGNQITLLINIMVEGSAALLEKSFDTIMNKFRNENQIIIKETARFSRVPGYPKPSLRISN